MLEKAESVLKEVKKEEKQTKNADDVKEIKIEAKKES